MFRNRLTSTSIIASYIYFYILLSESILQIDFPYHVKILELMDQLYLDKEVFQTDKRRTIKIKKLKKKSVCWRISVPVCGITYSYSSSQSIALGFIHT